MFITILTDFHCKSLIFHCSPQANDSQSINVFLCLPLALLPVNAIASNWLFLMMCPTNRICLLTIIFRRFLDVLALWSTSSFDTSSVHAICNIRRKNHISVASNCDFILWLTVQLSHPDDPYNRVDHTCTSVNAVSWTHLLLVMLVHLHTVENVLWYSNLTFDLFVIDALDSLNTQLHGRSYPHNCAHEEYTFPRSPKSNTTPY